jgi:pimeloyl-ACP methyl ester carboxylesterase
MRAMPPALSRRSAILALLGAPALLAGCVAARDVKPPVREHRVASREGTMLHWWERGRGGTTVLLIHGWTCDASFWDAQVDALAARYRVVTLDLAGHGFSGTPRRQWTIAEFADDVVRVADAARAKRVVLVGHSLGGPVAIEAAQRLGTRAIGVIGVDTMQDLDAPRLSPEEAEKRLAPFRADFPGTVTAFVTGAFFTPATSPALRERILKTMSSARPEIAVPAIQGLNDWDSAAAFAGLRAPVLLLNAAATPTNRAALERRSPGARVRTFEGVGHFLMMEQPQVFNVALLEELSVLDERSRGGAAPAR